MNTALTTWCNDLKRRPLAGKSHHHSNKSSGTLARTPHARPGSAQGDSSILPHRVHHSPHQGRTKICRSGCRASHTAGTLGLQDRSLLLNNVHIRETDI